MLERQLDTPEGDAMVVDDMQSPAICGAGIWPCCAAKGACNSNYPMLTGCCVCLHAACGPAPRLLAINCCV